jgi:hypothetical protein
MRQIMMHLYVKGRRNKVLQTAMVLLLAAGLVLPSFFAFPAPGRAAQPEADTVPQAQVTKTIDYLGDGGKNDETTLRGEDYYRLCLTGIYPPFKEEITHPQTQNIDVVFCLDFSNSMHAAMSATDATPRYEAMAQIMAGPVVKNILNNEGNKVSVVGFYGNAAYLNYNSFYKYPVSSDKIAKLTTTQNTDLNPLFGDAQTLVDWTGDQQGLAGLDTVIKNKMAALNGEQTKEDDPVRHKYMQGTNYTAGFRQVLSQLEKVKNDGNKKILVFLSDGVPTYYFPNMDAQAVENTTYQAIVSGQPKTMRMLTTNRWGNGGEEDHIYSEENFVDIQTGRVVYSAIYPYNMTTSMQGTLNVWNGSYKNALQDLRAGRAYPEEGLEDVDKDKDKPTDSANPHKPLQYDQITTVYSVGQGQVQQKLEAMGVDLTTFTIGISDQFADSGDSDAAYGSNSPYVLKQMAQTDSGRLKPGAYYAATNSGSLSVAIDQIRTTAAQTVEYKTTNVAISDTLSPYVRYCSAQPDLTVTRTRVLNDDGSPVPQDQQKTEFLWQNGSPTAAGASIIQSVTVPDTAGADAASGGQVKVQFYPDYQVDGRYSYALAFNVQASDQAYREFAEGGGSQDPEGAYANFVGEADTDYPDNATSAGRCGFPSNQGAETTYTFKDQDWSVSYPKPVIQVGSTHLDVTKVWKNRDGSPVAADQLPASVTVRLWTTDKDGQNPTDTGRTLTLSPDKGWKGTFTDLVPKTLKTDGTYEPVYYVVTEENSPPGYSGSIVYGGHADADCFADPDAARIDIPTGEGESQVVTHVFDGGEAGAVITNTGYGYKLPSTAGVGTLWFSFLGAACMTPLAARLWRRRRRQ